MFGTFALTALVASASALVARADVVPSVPGPGVVYKAGEQCHIEWDGDKDSTTVWKNMAIELMTGSNFQMVHVTTVATGQDGTVSGTFDHPCPQVNPNSAVYFYQFTSPLATTKQWTTRFAIASAQGTTVPPANAAQPGTGEAIPWGVGALVDPSTATPPPGGAGGVPAAANASASALPPTVNITSSVAPSSSGQPSSVLSTTSRLQTVSSSSTRSSSAPSATGTIGANAGNSNGATGSIAHIWQAAVALGASAMAFAILL